MLSHIYVLFFIVISFAIFSASGLKEAAVHVGSMLGYGSLPLISGSFIYNLRSYGFIIIIAILASTPIFVKAKQHLDKNRRLRIALDILEIPVLMLLLVIVTAYLADGSFNPFLYFRF